MNASVETTKYLKEGRNGGSEAFNKVYILLYDELHSIAHRHLFFQKRQGVTLNTTALVHETYERLIGNSQIDLKDRNHFFALTSKAMRYVLADYARSGTAQKRGGKADPISLDSFQLAVDECSEELETLNEALQLLSQHNERLEKIVELKFFGGLNYSEIAGLLNLSQRTVRRDWQRARAWIYNFAAPLITGLLDNAGISIEFDQKPGSIIGSYGILDKIGEGGMGCVYLARKKGSTYETLVAIKLVRKGLLSQDIHRRFHNEETILASLEHPGIARLFDGGIHSDGRPFFVMEYIEGEPIN
jgi:RNA polymerase sigma factor (TIGR02999 family)